MLSKTRRTMVWKEPDQQERPSSPPPPSPPSPGLRIGPTRHLQRGTDTSFAVPSSSCCRRNSNWGGGPGQERGQANGMRDRKQPGRTQWRDDQAEADKSTHETRDVTQRFSPGCRGWMSDAAVTPVKFTGQVGDGKRRRGCRDGNGLSRGRHEASINGTRPSRGCEGSFMEIG